MRSGIERTSAIRVTSLWYFAIKAGRSRMRMRVISVGTVESSWKGIEGKEDQLMVKAVSQAGSG
jgi:hypothetical protein